MTPICRNTILADALQRAGVVPAKAALPKPRRSPQDATCAATVRPSPSLVRRRERALITLQQLVNR